VRLGMLANKAGAPAARTFLGSVLYQRPPNGDRHPIRPWGTPKALTSDQASAVNVAVNENPAHPCSCLLWQIPTDQRVYQPSASLHIGSNN